MPRGQVVIVTGSRDWTDESTIRARLCRYRRGTILLHGECRGADLIAAGVGRDLGFQVLGHPYFKDLGFGGGPARNGLMIAVGVAYRDAGLYSVVVEAFPLPSSRGTWDCVRQAEKALLPVITGGVEMPK